MDTLAIIKRIETLLIERNIEKKQFYAESGVSSASFSQWNTGRYKPSKRKLESLAKYFGVSYEWLLNGKEPANNSELINDDAELTEYLEMLATRPECRMLFHISKNATKADVEKAVAIIEALRKAEGRD